MTVKKLPSLRSDRPPCLSGSDLSVGAVIGFTSIFVATLITTLAHRWYDVLSFLAVPVGETVSFRGVALIFAVVIGLGYLLGHYARVVATIETVSGDPSKGLGLELDAIAVVVIGGTLLSGGRGHLLGTLLGLLIFGTIQQAILFDGRLTSSWMRIVVGALLLAFILLQRLLVRR